MVSFKIYNYRWDHMLTTLNALFDIQDVRCPEDRPSAVLSSYARMRRNSRGAVAACTKGDRVRISERRVFLRA